MSEEKPKVIELREKLAKLAHEQWSGWMKYMFGKCHKLTNGKMVIPKWAVERWSWQMIAPYESLSKPEQESDRAEADKFITVINQTLVDIPMVLEQADKALLAGKYVVAHSAMRLAITELEIG